MKIASGVAVFLVLLGGILYYVFGMGSASYAAKILPEGTDFFVAVNPDLSQLKNFSRIKDLYMSVPEVKKAIDDDFKSRVKNEYNIDFETDIKPWLGGEMAFAIPEANSTNTKPDFLLYVATRDMNKTESCLKKIRDRLISKGVYFDEKTYQGAKLYIQRGALTPLVYALNKDFMLVSNSENVISQTLDRDKNKGKQSLSQNKTYKKVVSKLPGSRAGLVYVNPRDIINQLGRNNRELLQIGQQMGQYDGEGMALSFVSEGVRLDYAMSCLPEKVNEESTPTSDVSVLRKTSEVLPADAVACLGLGYLKPSLETFVNKTAYQPGLQDISRGINEFERETGINLEGDILSWMRGDAVVALLPEKSGMWAQRSNLPLGLLVAIGTNDRNAAMNKMDKISAVFSREGLIVQSDTYNGHEIRYLVEPYRGEVVGGYCLYNDMVLIGSSRELLQNVMGSSEHLVNSSNFKKYTNSLPEDKSDLLYIAVGDGTNLLMSNMRGYQLEEFQREVYPYLKPIKAVNFATKERKSKEDFVIGSSTIYIE